MRSLRGLDDEPTELNCRPRFVLDHFFPPEDRPLICSSAAIARVFENLSKLEREVMLVGALDCKCRMVHYGILSVGTTDQLMLRVGDAFAGATRYSATGIFLVHNHPSGSLLASAADIELTRDVGLAGMLLGYPLFDHVIIAGRHHRSLTSPEILRRHGGGVSPATLILEKGRVAAEWHCLACTKRNSTSAEPVLNAFRRRASIPQRCAACSSVSWVLYQPRGQMRRSKKAESHRTAPVANMAAEKTKEMRTN